MAELTAPKHTVTVSMGYTKNVGNFESLRIDVGLSADGAPGAHPDATFKKVAEWVETKLVEQVQSAAEQLGN